MLSVSFICTADVNRCDYCCTSLETVLLESSIFSFCLF